MRTFLIILTISLCASSAPLLAAAAMYVQSSASANTGGMTADAGQTVTDGDVSASALVQTNISSGSNGGTADITITTSKNGVTQTEHRHIDTPAGADVSISVATSSSTGLLGQTITIPTHRTPTASGQSRSGVRTVLSTASSTRASTSVAINAGTSTGTRALTGNWFTGIYIQTRSFFAHLFTFTW